MKKAKYRKTAETICPECGSVVEVDNDSEYTICQMCGYVWMYTI